MTIGGVILGIIFTILIAIGSILIFGERKPLVAIIIALVLITILWGSLYWYYNNTASGARALKDQQSNFNNGIERTITIKSYSGETIAEYSGRMDIETDNDTYILFDDEEGKRHIIYNTTGFILIDEN